MLNHNSRLTIALVAVLGLMAVVSQAINSRGCWEYEPLPDSLASQGYLGFKSEAHLHSKYYANISSPHALSFTISESSYVRFYYSGIAGYRTAVSLVNANGGAVVAQAMVKAWSQSFNSFISAGSYKLTFTFTRDTAYGTPVKCNPFIMELSVIPQTLMQQRVLSYTCPAAESFPTIDFTPLLSGTELHYSQDPALSPAPAVRPNAAAATTEFRFAKKYSFVIKTPGLTRPWDLSAVLNANFPVGGYLGLALESNSSAAAQTPSPSLEYCVASGRCTVGKKSNKDTVTLKAVVAPGPYSLWVFYATQQADSVATPCAPFSLTLDVARAKSEEDLLTCEALPLPSSLATRDILDFAGNIFMRRQVLVDLTTGTSKKTVIRTAAETVLKIYAHEHRLDADLLLQNNATGATIARAMGMRGPEILAVRVPAGSYILTLSYWGSIETVLCETITLEVVGAPVSASNFDFCNTRPATVLPDLSGLARLITPGASFSFNGTYSFLFNNDWTSRTVLTQKFSVTENKVLRARIGANFLYADMTLVLKSNDVASGIVLLSNDYHPTHSTNSHMLFKLLTPGNYTLSIMTGLNQFQKSSQPAAGTFAPCAPFTMAMQVLPPSAITTAVRTCGLYRDVPASLNIPEYLETSSRLQIFETFRVPAGASSYSSSRTSFTVKTKSLLRVFVPPHHLDIDIVLRNSTHIIDQSSTWEDSESITFMAQPLVEYTIELRFYHWTFIGDHSNDPVCFTFPLDLAIEPVANLNAAVIAQCPTNSMLPTSSDIPSTLGTHNEWHMYGDFYMSKSDQGAIATLNFTVSENIIFRVVTYTNTVLHHTSLQLASFDGVTLSPVRSSYGANSASLANTILSPGRYVLTIYDPEDIRTVPAEIRTSCIYFHMILAMEKAESGSTTDSTTCTAPLPPKRITGPGFLNQLSGSRVHLVGRYRADTTNRKWQMELTLTEASLLRMFIPALDHLDIDMALNYGTIANMGTLIDSRSGFKEEMMYQLLSTGNYVISLYFFGQESGLPSYDSCPMFPMQLAINPTTYYSGMVPSLTTACAAEYPPTTLTPNTRTTANYHWNPTATSPRYRTVIPFTVDTAVARLNLQLSSDFPSGQLSMKLSAAVISGILEINNTIAAQSATNRLYFDEYLFKGTYQLTIEDVNEKTPPTLIKCATYTLDYTLDTRVTLTPDMCMEVEKLPTDLYSQSGGSYSYGGPQSPIDGSIKLFGDHFFQSSLWADRTTWIKFNILQPSIIRVFTRTIKPNDIDLYLFNSREDSVPLFASLGTDEHESPVWRLYPKSDGTPYELKVYFFRTDPKTACNYFHFEVEIRTIAQARLDTVCPATLPAEDQRTPPSTIQINPGASVAMSSDYYYTSSFVTSNTLPNKLFRQRIALNVAANASLKATIRYNFVLNDFRLKIRSISTGALVSGLSDGSVARFSDLDFNNVLQTRLVPGNYYLDIEEDLARKNLTFTAPCNKFNLELTALAQSERAVVSSVSPQMSWDIMPCEDFYITVTFSQRVVNLPAYGIPAWLAAQNAMYLVDSSSTANILRPASASLDSTGTSLSLKFAKTSIALNKHYKLVVAPEKFFAAGNQAFSLDSTWEFEYWTATCDCNGHGTCQYPGITSCVYCECADPWTGNSCEACKTGFHAAGTTCVADEVCEPDSCNNHGTCAVVEGSVRCTCFDGYASVNDEHCNSCAVGYHGDINTTNCVKDTATLSDGVCDSLFLPTTLNTPAFLGYKGSVHLSGEYFIDTQSMVHDMHFDIEKDSLIRVYLEPHKVDIDAWLYLLKDDGVTISSVVDYGVSFNTEEVLFHALTGGTTGKPAHYLLRFRYFKWDKYVITNCESFELELGITPSADVKTEIATWASTCAQRTLLPDASSQKINTDMSYAPATVFSLQSGQATTRGTNFFWQKPIEIMAKKGYVPVVTLRVQSRFLPAQVNVMLESATAAKATHCASSTTPDSLCTLGDNTLNTNFIERVVSPGSYVVWLYEPIIQDKTLTSCSPFEFLFTVKYVPSEQSVWECNLPEMPITLNTPGYLNDAGLMHIEDTFLVTANTTNFRVSARSHFRVQADGATTFALTGINVNIPASTTIATTLESGYYELSIAPTAGSSCPSVHMEIAIEPVTSMQSGCPASPVASLPSLRNIRVPYHFGPTTASPSYTSFIAMPYSSASTRVTSYSFTVGERAIFSAALMSNFLYHSLGMKLSKYYSGSLYEVAKSKLSYNNHEILEVLTTGDYVLQLELPTTVRPSTMPRCLPFNFEFHLLPYTTANTCQASGEPTPLTWDSQAFLLPTGRMDWAAASLRLPTNFTLRTRQQITFTITATSVLRTYVSPNQAIDIDTVLLDSTGAIIASGSNSVYSEEALVTTLAPGQYVFEFWFWKWSTENLPACPTFRMQASIEPISAVQQLCKNGADHWPPAIPSPVTKKYSYISIHSYDDDLYFQQAEGKTKSFTLSFTLPSSYNFYAQVGYPFATSQLALRLRQVSTSGTAAEYSGVPTLHRNTILAKSLPAGKYELVLYEPVTNAKEILNCGHFTYSIVIDKESSLFSNMYASLPSNLNTVSGLRFSDSIYMADIFTMFRESDLEIATFTVAKESVVHATGDLHGRPTYKGEVSLEMYNTATGASSTLSFNELYTLAQPGTYQLKINKLSTATSSIGAGVGVDFSLAIAPRAALNAQIASSPLSKDCADALAPSVTLSDEGAFQYRDANRRLSWAHVLSAKGQPFQRLKLSLAKPTLFWAQIGYDFPLGHMELTIQLNDGSFVRGTQVRHLNTIKTTLPAGEHTLDLTMDLATTGLSTQRCTPFSFGISLTTVTSTGVDACAFYKTVPWDLNRYDGGSVQHGGPMDVEGVMHMYGTDFGVPSDRVSDRMSIQITRDSVVSVLLYTGLRMGAIHASLIETISGKAVPKMLGVAQTYSGKQFMATWLVLPEATFQTKYTIVLEYSGLTGSCGTFSMQIMAKPLSLLRTQITCESNTDTSLPTQGVSVLPTGFYADSRMGAIKSNTPMVTKGTPYSVSLNISQASYVQFSFSFNSLVNLFSTTLNTIWRNAPRLRNHAAWRPQLELIGDTTVTQTITDRLSTGKYLYTIAQPNFTMPFDSRIGTFCLPYAYTFELIPDNGFPYIAEVSPARARNLNPKNNLLVSVRFSESIYNAHGTLANSDLICSAFTLVDQKSSTTVIKPASCELAISSASSLFSLTFSSKNLKAATSYELKMSTGILYDKDKHSVVHTSSNVYNFVDTTCNRHGAMSGGVCVCDSGYAGSTCHSCDVGFLDISRTPEDLRCAPATTCEESTCGCVYVEGKCNPLGTCTINVDTGKAVCSCKSSNLGQPYCQSCAEGYENWPTCSKKAQSGTGAGTTVLLLFGLGLIGSGVCVGGFFAWKRWGNKLKRFVPGVGRYEMVQTNGDILDEVDDAAPEFEEPPAIETTTDVAGSSSEVKEMTETQPKPVATSPPSAIKEDFFAKIDGNNELL